MAAFPQMHSRRLLIENSIRRSRMKQPEVIRLEKVFEENFVVASDRNRSLRNETQLIEG